MSDEKRLLRIEFWVLSYLQTKQGLSILSLKTPVWWNLSFSIGVEQFNHVELDSLRLELEVVTIWSTSYVFLPPLFIFFFFFSFFFLILHSYVPPIELESKSPWTIVFLEPQNVSLLNIFANMITN